MNIYNFLVKNTELRGVYALIKAYQLYLEQVGIKLVNTDDEPSLSLTRAWTLIRFVEGRMLKMETCHCCHGQFIVNADDLNQNYTCNLCNVPSRAGKTKRVKENSLKAIEEVAYS
jgi:flagellar transcriptional activator FlhC